MRNGRLLCGRAGRRRLWRAAPTLVVCLATGATALGIGAASASATLVSVTLDGSGTGKVTSDPAGINCSNVPGALEAACSADFADFTTVKLSATAANGIAFKGWSGTIGGTCTDAVSPCTSALIFGLPLSATATFSPKPERPIVTTGGGNATTFPSAELAGTVDPNSTDFGLDGCFFEYGRTTEYGTTTPCYPRTVGPGTNAVAVTADAGALEPGAVYHYRLVASNAGGTSVGEDRTLTAAAAPADACPNAAIRAQQHLLALTLPDCRAYELVPPTNTGGQYTRALATTEDGNRLLFSSVGGFADTGSLLDLGIQYIAERGSTGWSTAAIAPPATKYPFLAAFGAVDYSDDLERTLWVVNKKEDEGTFRLTPIVRKDDGSFVDAGPTLDGGNFAPQVIGASDDMRTLVLSTANRPPLTDGSIDGRPVQKSLYVAHRGADDTIDLRQVGYRAGATMVPSCAIILGGLNTTTRGAVSRDGSRIFFSTGGALSACTNANIRRVWMKSGTAEPVDVSASQCTVDCGTAQQVLFEGASRDGSRVYFSTQEKLLDVDQDTSAKNDIYEYDFNASGAKLKPVTTSSALAGAGVVRVVRVSTDGSHIYFVANGRPLTGPNARGATPAAGGNNLYVYRRLAGEAHGSTTFVTALPATDSDLWGPDQHRLIKTSDDGRFAIFSSNGNLTGERQLGDAFLDIFYYDAQADRLRRVWSPEPRHNGASRTGSAVITPAQGGPAEGGFQKQWERDRQVTNDGAVVTFATSDNLSSADVNNPVNDPFHLDVYMWEAASGEIALLSGGTSQVRNARGTGPMSPSGDSIFVDTDVPLTKGHTSGAGTTFVLRRDGGFPEPPAPREPCHPTVDCQSPPTPRSGPLNPLGSSVFAGPGNPIPKADKPAPTIQVGKIKAVRGTVTRVKVRVPGKGKLRVSGRGLKRTSKLAGKAGTYRVSVKLSKRSRSTFRRKDRVKVRASVRFVPENGKTTVKRVSVTFKTKSKKRTSKGSPRSTREVNAPSYDVQKGR